MENIVITQSNINCLVVAAVILFLLPPGFVALWKGRCGARVSWKPLLIGAVGFVVSVRVLELLVHMVCIVMDNPVSRFINGHTWAYVLYGVTMAGVFEECGRYIIIGKLMKKNKTRENMVMYGIGHGGIEVWLISVMGIVSSLVVAVNIQNLGVQEGLAQMGVTAENLDMAMPTLTSIMQFGAGTVFLTVLERVVAMALHISMTVVVFYGVHTQKKVYLLYAVLAHMAADLFAALYQRGVCSMAVAEVWATAWAVGLALWAVSLYRKCETA